MLVYIHVLTSRDLKTHMGRGSVIGIVAPASPVDAASLALSIERLQTRYEVKRPPMMLQHDTTDHYLASDDTTRLEQLHWALEDDDVQAIVATRGGYGSMRLLSRMDTDLIRRAHKPIVGFSDITALHALWSRQQVPSVHGSMAGKLHELSDDAWSAWLEALENNMGVTMTPVSVLRSGEVKGNVVGGNLSIVCALAATPYICPVDDAIVVLEDVHEAPYRIDRMLTTLKLAGWWRKVSAVIFGQFTDAPVGKDGISVQQVIEDHFRDASFPVIFNAPFGHIDNPVAIRLGETMVLTAASDRLMLSPP